MFIDTLNSTELNQDTIDQMTTMIKAYETTFDKVVVIDDEIGRSSDEGVNENLSRLRTSNERFSS